MKSLIRIIQQSNGSGRPSKITSEINTLVKQQMNRDDKTAESHTTFRKPPAYLS